MLLEFVFLATLPLLLGGMTTAAVKFPKAYPQLLLIVLTTGALCFATVIVYDSGQMNMAIALSKLTPVERLDEQSAVISARFKLEMVWLYVATPIALYLIAIKDLYRILDVQPPQGSADS